MRVVNNLNRGSNNYYSQNSPSFGALKSIQCKGAFNVKNYPNEVLWVMKAFRDSEGISKFCKKYDVEAIFNAKEKSCSVHWDEFDRANASVTLRTRIQKTQDNEIIPEISLCRYSDSDSKHNNFADTALYKLSKAIKSLTFENLETELHKAIENIPKPITPKNKIEKDFNDIVKSLLSNKFNNKKNQIK